MGIYRQPHDDGLGHVLAGERSPSSELRGHFCPALKAAHLHLPQSLEPQHQVQIRELQGQLRIRELQEQLRIQEHQQEAQLPPLGEMGSRVVAAGREQDLWGVSCPGS